MWVYNGTPASTSTAPGGLLTGASSGALATRTPVTVFANVTDQKTVMFDVWVPSGTVVSGTGTFRIIVTEYNEIS